MKKLILLGALVIVAGGAYFMLSKEGVNVLGNKSSSQAAGGVSSGGKFRIVDACSVMTVQDAQSQLGEGAKQGVTEAGNASSDDNAVSNCVYYVTSTTTNGYRTVSVLSRSAKTKAGAESNKSQFNESMPPGVINVVELGDAAFWNPELGQMNVLKGDNWYIVTVGSTKAADRKQSDANAFVMRIQSKF